MSRLPPLLLPLILGPSATASGAAVTDVSLGGPLKPFGPQFWTKSVGSGHAKLALRDDWQQQLKAVHDDLGIVGVRFHGTFDDDMGPVVTGTPANPVYNFTLVDKVYDGIRAAGVTPIIELSFMPGVLANCTPGKCRTTMEYRGITEPPVEWPMWGALVAALAEHMIERYTLDVVATFKFEVWNELWGMPWGTGLPGGSQYMAMYNESYRALKAVSPRLQVGGPATMEVKNVADFVAALKAWDVSADFVSTHLYPTDWCDSEPDARTNLDCFTENIANASRQAAGFPFYITEYNCGWKDTDIHDGESTDYAASFALRTVNLLRGKVDVLSWWTFSSIFEEGGLPTNEFGPFGANSAMQTVHGVPMPVYRGFQLLSTAGNLSVPVTIDGSLSATGVDGTLSVMATAGGASGPYQVYLSNFAPDDNKGVAAAAGGASTDAGRAMDGAVTPPGTPCDPAAFEKDVDYPGGDLLPESQKFTTPNASACCEACKHFQVDKFCAVWSWGLSGGLTRCYLKSASAIPNKKAHPGFTAGFPGAPPPPPSNHPWYNTTRTVVLTIPDALLGEIDGSSVTVTTINSTCANPKPKWIEMGSPTWPTESQLAALTQASQVCTEQQELVRGGEGGQLTLTLEAYSAVAVHITPSQPWSDSQ